MLPGNTVAALPHTIFRLRLRRMPGLNDALLLRLFFEDREAVRPTVTGWSETGAERFPAQRLGGGTGLPASESLAIPTRGVDYLEIDVPGNGRTVTKALLATLKQTAVVAALDFAPAAPVQMPFGEALPADVPTDDTFLFGRVRATLDPGPIRLSHEVQETQEAPALSGSSEATEHAETPTDPSTVQFSFQLESEPLLALVTFEVLNADPLAPLEAWANDQPLGTITAHWPDLADPGYAGIVRPFEKMRFHYTGWVRCQMMVPGAALRNGGNTITLRLPQEAVPVAVRAVELQLKHPWQKLDYTLAP